MRELILAWLRDARHLRWILALAAALVVLGAAGFGVSAWLDAQESRARLALAAALDTVQQASGAAPPDARDGAVRALEAVLAEHPRFSGAPEAAYRLGNLHYEAGRYPAARGAYQIALGKGAAGTLRILSALGIAYSFEAEKDYPRAQTAYQAALAGLGPRDFLYEEVLIGLARTQESAGDLSAARESYARLLKDRPDTRRADDVKSRLAGLSQTQK